MENPSPVWHTCIWLRYFNSDVGATLSTGSSGECESHWNDVKGSVPPFHPTPPWSNRMLWEEPTLESVWSLCILSSNQNYLVALENPYSFNTTNSIHILCWRWGFFLLEGWFAVHSCTEPKTAPQRSLRRWWLYEKQGKAACLVSMGAQVHGQNPCFKSWAQWKCL